MSVDGFDWIKNAKKEGVEKVVNVEWSKNVDFRSR